MYSYYFSKVLNKPLIDRITKLSNFILCVRFPNTTATNRGINGSIINLLSVLQFFKNIFYLCPVFKPMTAAKRAKKNPANPVAPVSNTSNPIKTGINVKNLSLYANSSGSRNFFNFFFTLNFPLPSPFGLISKSEKRKTTHISIINMKNFPEEKWQLEFMARNRYALHKGRDALLTALSSVYLGGPLIC